MSILWRLSVQNLSTGAWIILQGVLGVVAVAVSTILLEAAVDASTAVRRLGFIAALVLGAMLYFAITTGISWARETVFPKYPAVVLEMQRRLLRSLEREASSCALREAAAPMERAEIDQAQISEFLRAVQDVVEDGWVKPRFGERVNLDVALMTKSLRDGGVTVGAWAIRKPHSLAKRATDPELYKETEAARLYREDEEGSRVTLRVIADTEQPEVGYWFINRSEEERIRSTVLAPVYSPGGRLLGFVVAHASRPGVFLEKDGDFWAELLALICVHVARQILRVEEVVKAHPEAAPW